MATTRATLRSSIQRKSDGKLTVAADQDVVLDLAERQVLSDWSQFDKSLLRYDKDSGATNASGVVELDAETVEVERVQTTDDRKYDKIEIEEQFSRTGYYFMGIGTSNTKKQIVVSESGSRLASTTIEWFALKLSLMGTPGTAESVLPEEFREIIAIKAAEIYYQEQGPALLSTARHWSGVYGELPDPPRIPRGTGWIGRAWKAYKSIDDEVVLADTMDPDAGDKPLIQHVIT